VCGEGLSSLRGVWCKGLGVPSREAEGTEGRSGPPLAISDCTQCLPPQDNMAKSEDTQGRGKEGEGALPRVVDRLTDTPTATALHHLHI
jgi:hypothetical protein